MTTEAVPEAGEIRCECGRLLARRIEGGIELKCRRCDRTVTIAFRQLPDDGGFVETE